MAEPTGPSNATPDTNANAPATAEVPEVVEAQKHGSAVEKSAEEKGAGPPLDVQAITDRALHFLANASNETLGACLVGLGAGTYLVLGRVGLVLIGVVGGVVLHATWEGQVHGDRETSAQKQEARRRELGADVAHRVLGWRDEVAGKTKKAEDEGQDHDVKLYSGKHLDFSDFRPETAAALTELTDAVIRDYVKWWYSPILPNEQSFPAASRQTLVAFLLSVSSHLSRKRPADSFLDFVTNSSSILIVFFNELSAALAASPSTPAPEAIETYLQSKPDSNLAHVLDTAHQAQKLDLIAEDILQNYLEPKTYNCKPAITFLREILAKVVLEMTIASCSKPEWINGWIVYLLEESESELLNAIDAGVEDSSSQLQNVKNTVVESEKAMDSAEVKKTVAQHKRVVSRAQDAMDEAMREAQRLSQLIAEEDAKRLREQKNTSSSTLNDDQSESTTQGIVTPTSSQSETPVDDDVTDPGTAVVPTPAPSQVGHPSSVQISEEPPKQDLQKSFTSFDQLVPNQPPTALMASPPPPLTLHNSNIVIFDDSMPGEKGTIKNKPSVDYLIQIEPKSNHHSGWMTARKFSDLETLHEVLRRIAAITGATGFTEAHRDLPTWKGHTKASLRGELERYLNDACQFKPLAESEGMKRFLEKETGQNKSPGGKGFPGIGWPGQTFENMGKGMIDVLTKAPKEVAGGGKAVFGGITGVLGNVAAPLGGSKKRPDSVSSSPAGTPAGTLSRSITTPGSMEQARRGRAESTISELPTHIRTESTMSSFAKRPSTDSIRNPTSPIIDQQPGREAPMERRPSYNPDGDGKRSGPSSIFGQSRSNSRAPSTRGSMDLSPTMGGDQILNLPPMPSDITDDYADGDADPLSVDQFHSRQQSRASTSSLQPPTETVPPLPRRPSTASTKQGQSEPQKPTTPKQFPPLTTQETTVLVELLFAVINELYTLSSAWNIRRTLLNAAKTFLLRPGNPQLESIRQLINTTVLTENLSDAGIALQLKKIRENSLPTEEELKKWPPEATDEEKVKLRIKARKLLVEKGMPQALTSVMGAAASGEALGKLFDCLQEPRVARGVIFGLLLQGMRVFTQ